MWERMFDLVLGLKKEHRLMMVITLIYAVTLFGITVDVEAMENWLQLVGYTIRTLCIACIIQLSVFFLTNIFWKELNRGLNKTFVVISGNVLSLAFLLFPFSISYIDMTAESMKLSSLNTERNRIDSMVRYYENLKSLDSSFSENLDSLILEEKKTLIRVIKEIDLKQFKIEEKQKRYEKPLVSILFLLQIFGFYILILYSSYFDRTNKVKFRADTVCVPGVLADTFRISCLTDTLQLQSTRRKEGTNTLRPASSFTNLYYGLTLKNGGRGILYHSIGVNGAMYVNYTDEAYIRQLALLKPSLLIISMGTNETFGRRFNTDEFSGQIEAFLALVKKELPNTAILLTTPPECYRRVRSGKQRTYVRNDNTERAARAIRNVAKKEEVACWDLFTTTGGKNSCRKWHSSRLMGRDRIHFTKEGYQEQGTLLFRAFMESYNNR